MTLVKFKPATNWLDTTDSLVRDLFNDSVRVTNRFGNWMPAVDIEEHDDKILVNIELPGMNKDDFKITVKDDMLLVSGEKKVERNEESKNYRYFERRSGKFERSFRLHTEINRDKISANYTNGVLTLELPKADEVKPKEIEVKIG